MARLFTKVGLYLEANDKNRNLIGRRQDNAKVQLCNDGDGDYIKVWNVDGLAQPTAEQLASYGSVATTEDNNIIIRRTRKKAYGDIGDQLDEIFKDIEAWKTRIQAIKDANAKE